MSKLPYKYEKLIELDNKAFLKRVSKRKKEKEQEERKKQLLKERPFIPYKNQLKDKRWLKKRAKVLRTKGYKCERCGADKNLIVHHLKYERNKYAWEYPITDLMVLCQCCHEEIHCIDLDKRFNFLTKY